MKKLKIEKVREILGKRIRKKRRELDITQNELGKRIGCVTSFICEMEKGRRSMSTENLYKLECVLGPLWGNYDPEA
ncbi:MAG: hypothetical protein OM95_07070 [Bdellovibrio sp. ArHS]|uniref:helix-turn-helix domain-containing protein n=1 Tax=Bdellovibrio sp. ArHS TaxID=1569284 RepID=UPI000582DCF6|nr:helix-turn-helix transcriptional regulator [Bdellovibrio sp. ArHS]KHD88870.1 MAG: hypothetical protein OM95_07070 [Bdellovibrio sp. ArHS]